jgi:hypothetical protein
MIPHSAAEFAQSNTLSTTFSVTATDRAGNEGTQPFVLANDAIPPTATVTVPSASGLGIPVAWTGQDDQAGIRHYDVQVRENDGDWDDWLTAVDTAIIN